MSGKAVQTLRIFSTAIRKKVRFEPRVEGAVSMYVCGPTVYDVPHLGHGRTALTYDIIRRYLIWRGFTVTLASNVTDIDDKIIARASAEGRSEPEVAAEFTAAYDKEMQRLDVLPPDSRPHATQFVPQMLEVISQLLDQGLAYAVPQRGVYMSVESVAGYGGLAGRTIEQMLQDAGSRVDVDPNKRSPLDFALWRAADPGEPAWDTPWGSGRPGWHTECVAMSLAALGEGFDIHGGGDDLVFPHHQNEWAQVEALGKDFARYWLHSAMVNVGGQKMAKSVGNFTNLSEAIDEVGSRAVRMAVLQTHYRKAMEMDKPSLAAAAVAVDRLDAFARRVRVAGLMADAAADQAAVDQVAVDQVAAGRAITTSETYVEIMDRFVEVMNDDFATPAATDLAFSTLRKVNAALDAASAPAAGASTDPAATDSAADTFIAPAAQAVTDIFEVLGISTTAAADGDASDAGADPEIERLVAAREQARSDKDFAKADEIREQLSAQGVVIEDTPTGATWRKM